MKKKFICWCMSLLLVLGCMFVFEGEYKASTKNENAQLGTIQVKLAEEVILEETVDFEYPITPADPEWKEIGSVKAKIEACRIPAETLDKMTDDQLIQAIIDFPFLIDAFLANTEKEAVASLERTCDAYRELLSRSTAKNALLNRVEQQISVCSTDMSAKQEIVNDALAILILYQEDFEGKLTVKDVNNLAELSSQIEISEELQSGAQPYAVSVPTTPSGTAVAYITFTCVHNNIAYHTVMDQMAVDTYNVELISTGSCKYNCHSYAWHSRLTTNKYWINDPTPYMQDPVYSLVLSGLNTFSSSAEKDDIVFYGTTLSPTHSAVLIQDGVGVPLAKRYVQSKWGGNGCV